MGIMAFMLAVTVILVAVAAIVALTDSFHKD